MISKRQRISRLFLAAVMALFGWVPAAQTQTGAYQGFGATTRGGEGGTVVHVTNLNDSGPGSLREAVSQGNRTIVFDVAGDIHLSEFLYVRGAFVTIDGFTAPSPGITLRDWSLAIAGDHGAHDVIVRGIRVRDSVNDGIMIKYSAYNVVIDHVSTSGAEDGNIDVTRDAHDITVSWSILAGNVKNSLIKYHPSRITFHHNLFISGVSRNPLISMDDTPVLATDITVDFRNNLVWAWGTGIGFGTWVEHGARANIVNNLYKAQGGNAALSLMVDTLGRAYTAGNMSADGLNVNLAGNQATAFPAAAVDTQSACAAAQLIVANVGMRSPIDSVDAAYLAGIALPFCQSPSASLVVTPTSLGFRASSGGPDPAAQQLAVAEQGGGNLAWTATATTVSGGSWLSVSPASGTTPSSLAVATDPGGLGPGTYRGSVVVTATGATNSPRTVPVTLVVDEIPSGEGVVEAAVSAGVDDAREYSATGVVRTTESYLSLGRSNLVALRFSDVDVPKGAVIQSAVLELYGAGALTADVRIRYSAEDVGNSGAFTTAARNLSSRARTQAVLDDVPGSWSLGEFSASPDLKDIVQEVVSRPDWGTGHSLTIFLEDRGSSGVRRVGSFEWRPSPSAAARLTIQYEMP